MSIRPKPPEDYDDNPSLESEFFTRARPAAPRRSRPPARRSGTHREGTPGRPSARHRDFRGARGADGGAMTLFVNQSEVGGQSHRRTRA